MRKTHNLTRRHAKNDPIDLRIKGSSLLNFEDKFRHSRGDFSLFSQQNLTLKHSSNAKNDLEEEKSKRFKD